MFSQLKTSDSFFATVTVFCFFPLTKNGIVIATPTTIKAIPNGGAAKRPVIPNKNMSIPNISKITNTVLCFCLWALFFDIISLTIFPL